MVSQENATLESIGAEEATGIKPALQPGIQLPPASSTATTPTNPAATPTATSGLTSPGTESQRSSLDLPRSRSRDVRSPGPTESGGDEPRDLIVQSFAPRIAVYSSADADELIRLKGLYGGLCALFRPFGEQVTGKVVIRTSSGTSKSWTDFGICFTEFDRSSGHMTQQRASGTSSAMQSQTIDGDGTSAARTEEARARTDRLNEVVQAHIQTLARQGEPPQSPFFPTDAPTTTPQFRHFLRRLLAGRDMVPHETFTHPVACVIAITSQNSTPIDTLRDLYNDTRQESENMPAWVGNEFLRYYVLIHDDDQDDIAKSMALFNQMKRHFGLNTHLLRLRGVQCLRDAADAVPLPACQWLSPEEELTEIRQRGDLLEFDEFQQYVFETDAVAIRAFIREMVTQSVVPFMESRIATWNDQVASRRRGISGRFMSLSKRWTGFGGGRKNSETPSSKSNYSSTLGGYHADSNEASMHRLADWALLLRDWKLAASTYDMLRSDFGDDKAWAHYAVAHEGMAACLLLGAHPPRSTKVDTLDQLIDTATYSYITRCGDPFSALRCLVVMVELFRARGGSAIEEAAKWATRLLELTILTPLLQTLVAERLACAYASQTGTGLARWGSQPRKAAFWHLLGAGAWLDQAQARNARTQLEQARRGYDSDESAFDRMASYLHILQDEIARIEKGGAADTSHALLDRGNVEDSVVDEETKAFDHDITAPALTPRHAKRFSISQGSVVPPSPGVEVLQQLKDKVDPEADGFA